MNQVFQPNPIKPEVKETIQFLEIIHLISNIFSGGFLGVIVITLYLVMNKEIDTQLKGICYDLINFNLSFIIYSIIGFISLFILIGFLLLPAIYCTWLILMIIGAIKHFAWERYEYPLIIQFLK